MKDAVNTDATAVGNLQEINPELFLFENHENDYWERFEWDFNWSHKTLVNTIIDRAIGICDGSRLGYMPCKDEYGVMFEDRFGKFWFHIDRDIIDDIRDGRYKRNGDYAE